MPLASNTSNRAAIDPNKITPNLHSQLFRNIVFASEIAVKESKALADRWLQRRLPRVAATIAGHLRTTR